MTKQLALFAMQQRAKQGRPVPTWVDYTAVMRRKCDACVAERHAEGRETMTVRDARRRHTPSNRYYCYPHAYDAGDERA
jgi:hypothetical protein